MYRQAKGGVETTLILYAAGTAAKRVRDRELASRLASSADWSLLAEMLTSLRLVATLGPHLLAMVPATAARSFNRHVQEAVEITDRINMVMETIIHHVTSALTSSGIASAPLKGPSLGMAIYGHNGRRSPSCDIDLLVAPQNLPAAAEVLSDLGYIRSRQNISERNGLPRLHLALVHKQRVLPAIDLHWRIHWYESDFSQDRLLPPGPSSRWRPAPADELVALLLYYARDGFVGLKYVTDLAAWWDVYGDRLPAGGLSEALRAYPPLAPAIRAGAVAANRVVGLPVVKVIPSHRTLAIRGRLAVELADPLPRHSMTQRYAVMGLIDGLLAPRGAVLGFFKRQFIAPFPVAPPRGFGTSLAAGTRRAAGLVARYAWAIAAILGASGRSRALVKGGRGAAQGQTPAHGARSEDWSAAGWES